MDTTHLAEKANIASVTLASSKQKQAWLDLYADDAVLKDPVGISPFDPEGQGHRGKAAIEAFWDNVIGPANMTINVIQRLSSGTHDCAVLQEAVNDLGNGQQTIVTMIATYRVNDEGKITAMSAYWDFDGLMQQLQTQSAQG